MSVSRVNY